MRPGVSAALGAPAVAMGATFLAFGAAVREAGLPWALGAALLVYGMPGQLVLLRLAAAGARWRRRCWARSRPTRASCRWRWR
ncbi:hypothetical protein GCM10009416_49300 [Craurococcus roseus]|uniref:Uncharacterized protein n=2 Tax=Craurococcus roseus TaxID=77585 RepID=A0ABP3RFD1_9PROT